MDVTERQELSSAEQEAAPDTGPDTAPDDAPAVSPPRLHLSPAAVEEIRGLLEEEDLRERGGLRISARSGAGCSAPVQFGLVLETAAAEDDVVLEGRGIRIFLDPMSAWSLDGLVVDWVDDPDLGEGFAFRHPRGAGGRRC